VLVVEPAVLVVVVVVVAEVSMVAGPRRATALP
jgi:hypothetical protein